MAETTSKPTSRNADVWVDYAWAILCHTGGAVLEIGYGIRANTIPWITCCGLGALTSVLISTHLDRFAWKLCHGLKFYPVHPKPYWIYCFAAVTTPFWLWAWNQVFLRIRLMRRLKDALTDSGLKTNSGRLPRFISNLPIDLYTHKLRLRNVGLPKAQFEKAREALGAGLQVFIDEVKEHRQSGTVDLVYSHVGMPESSDVREIKSYGGFQFVVGDTRGNRLVETLRDVPHLLIAGQSGAGKSTFLRQLLTALYVNNPHCQFTGIDLKGGLEFQLFEDLKRMHVLPDLRQAVKSLEKFEKMLENRMALLKANRCKDLDAYFAILPEKRKSLPELNSKDLDRYVVVIDEAAEMFLAGDHASPQEIQKAKRVLSKISRQGRAVGVHLVIATQRPDKQSLDSQVKANLVGVLCYAMQNDASSMTVLGNGRATDLPSDVKGRAIWKKNGDMTEVQTPILSVEDAAKLLDECRKAEGKEATAQQPAEKATSDNSTPNTPIVELSPVSEHGDGTESDGKAA